MGLSKDISNNQKLYKIYGIVFKSHTSLTLCGIKSREMTAFWYLGISCELFKMCSN